LFLQASLKLCKSTIRLFRYKFHNEICMWLKRESLVPRGGSTISVGAMSGISA